MGFLYLLESVRNSFLDSAMLVITALGEETIFMVIAMFLLWCVDKYEGYYMLTIGFIGTQINQLLKVIFRVPRPWVRDPNFKPVAGAVEEATGYSFPSGHTQSAVGSFGAVARWNKNKWLRIICVALALLVAFSRMYLGVHTPIDVLISLGIATILVFGLYPVFKKARENHKVMHILLVVLTVWSIAQVLFMELYPFPQSANGEELFSGLKNAYKMAGAVVGLIVVFEVDRRFTNFKTEAVWWAQVLKVVLGLGLTLAVKEICYFVFGLFCSDTLLRGLSYFMMVLFAGIVWPLTFKWFSKLGNRNKKSA